MIKLTWCAPDNFEARDGIPHPWFQYSFGGKRCHSLSMYLKSFYHNNVTKVTFFVSFCFVNL